MGIAAASAAVRRAPAPNSAPGGRTIRLGLTRRNANGEGAVGSARGGRAPRIRLNRTASSSILGRVLHFGCSGALCQVGRVTPCAPLGERIRVCGAHGVTRPTLLALRQAELCDVTNLGVVVPIPERAKMHSRSWEFGEVKGSVRVYVGRSGSDEKFRFVRQFHDG